MDFYRSPAPARPAPQPEPAAQACTAPVAAPRRPRGTIPLVLFSAGLLALLLALLTLRLTGWDWYFTPVTIESVFDGGETENDYGDFGDFFDYYENDTDQTEETTISQGELDESFQLELVSAGESLSFSDIYEKVLPSIVSIQAEDASAVYSGTGVILTENGYILTNYHVITGCSDAWVTLSGGGEYQAALVGYDVESDLAVLKIQAQSLPSAEFGDSDQLQVGDTVLAIGNPLGDELFGTMTEGIVSAVNRDINVDGYTMTLIQTSAALNPGNSGGALVNTSGQVVGITNMKMMSDYETIEGLGFAIPSTWVKEVADILVTSGRITGRPTIGISCYALTDSEALALGIDGGIYVSSVTSGGPAEQAGLQEGDIILTANSQALSTLEQFTDLRDQAGVGGQLELTVLRDGETITVTLILAEQADVT